MRVKIVVIALLAIASRANATSALPYFDEPGSCTATVDPLTGDGACTFRYAGGSITVEGTGAGPAFPSAWIVWRNLPTCFHLPVTCVPIPVPSASVQHSTVTVSVEGPSGLLSGCSGVYTCGPYSFETGLEPGTVLTCRAGVSAPSGAPTGPFVGRFACDGGGPDE
jgi:hypothetical protein